MVLGNQPPVADPAWAGAVVLVLRGPFQPQLLWFCFLQPGIILTINMVSYSFLQNKEFNMDLPQPG